MSDNRKYYYLKLKENYFDDDSIVLLESMQDGVLYSNILLKLYLKSLKHGGRLQLDEDIPYTAQMIATITRQQIGTVERALQIFLKLGLVEVLESGTFYILLDEPGAFLDVRAQFELLDLLRSVAAGGKAVVLVMHELPQAMQYADRIALLGGGRLLGCDTSAALAATGAVDRVFGVRLCRAPDGVWYVKAEG